MKFKLGIETEIGQIELEISELQNRLQQVKDFETKAVALLYLAKEIANSTSCLANDFTIEGLVNEIVDILDPGPEQPAKEEVEPESEQPAKEEAEPESENLAIGTRVKSIYSEMFGTVESFEKALPGLRYRYQYKVNWDNPPIDPKQKYWDTELIEQPHTHKSVTPQSLISINNPHTGETISWVAPGTDEFKVGDFCYLLERGDAGVIGQVKEIFRENGNVALWVNLLNKAETDAPVFFIPVEEALKVNKMSNTVYQCSDSRVLLDCSKKNLAVGWENQFELWGCNCKVIKLNKLWRVEIRGLSAERVEKLVALHTSSDTPCPESHRRKPSQPDLAVTNLKLHPLELATA